MSRIRKIEPLKLDPETGQPICRHWNCHNPVPKGRRSWCGPACVHDAQMQSNPGYARDQVHARDKGRCAACGRDCDALRLQVTRMRNWIGYRKTEERLAKRFGCTERQYSRAIEWSAYNRPGARVPGYAGWIGPALPEGLTEETCHRIYAYDRRLRKLARAWERAFLAQLSREGFDTSRTTYWDMDHKIEIIRGGGYQLDNLQTLCQPCHKAKTARLAAERAEERRQATQPILPIFPD